MLLDDPLLPSPNQLKYKILIKNKKIQRQPFAQHSQQFTHHTLSPQTSSTYQHSNQTATPTKQLSVNNLKIEASSNNGNDADKYDLDEDAKVKSQVQKSKSFNDTAFNKLNATKGKINGDRKSAQENADDNDIRR